MKLNVPWPVEACAWPPTGPKEYWGQLPSPKNFADRQYIQVAYCTSKDDLFALEPSCVKLTYRKQIYRFDTEHGSYYFEDWIYIGK